MNNKKYLILAFIVVALVQLYVPAKMIFDSENILKEGTAFKFNAAPVDPNDPFRGKYITLNYKETDFKVSNEMEWRRNEIVYVTLINDVEGYAKIQAVSKEKPSNTIDFVKATVDYVSSKKVLHFHYSFNRYYMEESKAYDAEIVYNESLRNIKEHKTYALVYIKDGEAVLDDVLIDGISIKEIVKE